MKTPARAVVAAALLIIAALIAGCSGSATPRAAPKLSAPDICARYTAQVLWLTYMSNPSPQDAAKLDAEIAADARESASASLAAALRATPQTGEHIASGDNPVGYESPVTDICSRYP